MMTLIYLFAFFIILSASSFKFVRVIKFNKFVSAYNTFKKNYAFFRCLQRIGTKEEITDYANILKGYAYCILKSGKNFTNEKAEKLTSDVEVILSEL